MTSHSLPRADMVSVEGCLRRVPAPDCVDRDIGGVYDDCPLSEDDETPCPYGDDRREGRS